MAKADGVVQNIDEIASELENMPEQETNWRIGENGDFVIELADLRSNRASSFVLTCAGNAESQTLEFLQVGQEEFRPSSGEIWSY